MELQQFLDYVKTGQPLDTEEIGRFMDEMSDEARRVTFELKSSRRSTRISARTSTSGAGCSSTPAATSRTTAA